MQGPALGRMARVVRLAAKARDFVFRDRRRRLGYPSSLAAGDFRDLRQSIRSRRISGKYGGRRFRSGRAAVFVGGSGARQGFLVEEGHGGPRPARPYPFLRQALLNTASQQTRGIPVQREERLPPDRRADRATSIDVFVTSKLWSHNLAKVAPPIGEFHDDDQT